jgi:DNA-directed RNA polymerase specialized sigma24 family protein
MDTCLQIPTALTFDLCSDSSWASLYPRLLTLVKRWVYASNVLSWTGQESDVAWDIVLTSIKRTFEYVLKARSEGTNIASLERLSIVIAKNCFLDLRRKDLRLLHLDHDEHLQEGWPMTHNEANLAEAVLAKLHEEWLFREVAKVVVDFPEKMRMALLIDLARRMDFNAADSDPTPLQKAFLEVGIQLQEYQHLLPKEPAARARHFSLVSLGYKRIARLIKQRECAEAA